MNSKFYFKYISIFLIFLSLSSCKIKSHESHKNASSIIIKDFKFNCNKSFLPQQFRAVWLTCLYNLDWPKTKAQNILDEQKQKEELVTILNQLQKEHFNAVFFQVRLRGSLIYKSNLEPFAREFSSTPRYQISYDILDFAIKECHKRGITFHAWFVTYPVGSTSYIKKTGVNNIKSRHPDWLVFHNGEWYLDPGNPSVHKHIKNLINELITKYDIDGIHFDYIRYPEKALSFSDYNTYVKYGKGLNKKKWRQNNISSLLNECAKLIRTQKPHILISVATIGYFRPINFYSNRIWTCQGEVEQDIQTWIKNKSIDFIVPMMYNKNQLFYPFLKEWKNNFPKTPIVVGLAPYKIFDHNNWTANDIDYQVHLIMQEKLNGFSFFREEHIHKNEQIKQVLKRNLKKNIRMQEFNSNLAIPPSPININLKSLKKGILIQWSMPKNWKDETLFNLIIENNNKQHLFPILYKNQILVSKSFLSKGDKIFIESMNRRFVIGQKSLPFIF